MKALIKAVKRALSMYQVIVHWEGQLFEHFAMTYREALEWIVQYPAGNAVIYHKVRGWQGRVALV